VRRVSGCTLRTLYFVNSGEVASDNLSSDDVSLGALSSDSLFQTHIFRCISSDALSFNKIPLLFDLFNHNLYE